MKKISEFLYEIHQFLEVNFSIYLHRRVFVMRESFSRGFESGLNPKSS